MRWRRSPKTDMKRMFHSHFQSGASRKQRKKALDAARFCIAFIGEILHVAQLKEDCGESIAGNEQPGQIHSRCAAVIQWRQQTKTAALNVSIARFWIPAWATPRIRTNRAQWQRSKKANSRKSLLLLRAAFYPFRSRFIRCCWICCWRRIISSLTALKNWLDDILFLMIIG